MPNLVYEHSPAELNLLNNGSIQINQSVKSLHKYLKNITQSNCQKLGQCSDITDIESYRLCNPYTTGKKIHWLKCVVLSKVAWLYIGLDMVYT